MAVASTDDIETPPLINFFLGYELTDETATMLSRWDIVVLDMDQTYQFPEQMKLIKRLNPDIKLIAYISAGEISEARFHGSLGSPGRNLADQIPEQWFLGRPSQSRISWWPGAWLMNATNGAPLINGERWNTFLPRYIHQELMSKGIWDGVFLDGGYSEVTSKFGAGLDINNDGIVDDPKTVDEAYRDGMKTLLQNTRKAIGDDRIIIANSSLEFAQETNGILFENFPRYGFDWPFRSMQDISPLLEQPNVLAINTNTNNLERPNDYRLMRYGLASTLIAGGYYSFDAGDAKHHRTWWYDEYEAPIGVPNSAPKNSSGLWSRQFTNGYVIVNPTKKAITIQLPTRYQKLFGRQDPQINTGEILNEVSVPPEDGLLLVKPKG
ncbi:MAG: hypothetical protein H6759_04110 [Candidatus Nomurabacteria bacterium]|nr:MAG: hypothetical protein H6759_04110 [Candidatus Nomurabacteria bacterium]